MVSHGILVGVYILVGKPLICFKPVLYVYQLKGQHWLSLRLPALPPHWPLAPAPVVREAEGLLTKLLVSFEIIHSSIHILEEPYFKPFLKNKIKAECGTTVFFSMGSSLLFHC